MTTFDYVIIIVFIIAFSFGYRKGLLKQLGTFCALFASIAVCRVFTSPLSEWLEKKGYMSSIETNSGLLENEYFKGVIISVLLFVVTFIIVKTLVASLQYVVESMHLSLLNKLGGVVFSCFLSFLILSMGLNVLQLFKTDGPIIEVDGLAGGKLASCVMNMAPATLGVASTWVKNINNFSNDETSESISK